MENIWHLGIPKEMLKLQYTQAYKHKEYFSNVAWRSYAI